MISRTTRYSRSRRLVAILLVALLSPSAIGNLQIGGTALIVDGKTLQARARNPESDTVPLTAVFRFPHQSVVVTTGDNQFAFHERAEHPGQLSLIPGLNSLWDWQPEAQQDHAELQIYSNNNLLGAIQAFTLHPINKQRPTHLGKFRMGRYPSAARSPNADFYAPPAGFIRVTPNNRAERVSDHFRLEQFLCKQQGGWPKYVALTPALLAKLDALVRALQAKGLDIETLTVMSGYRTPFYNKAIGNVAFSRHIYGDAADVFVDRNGDGRMDDLNGDGRSDVRDAQWLAAVAASLDGDDILDGGVGTYRANHAHGPFVHVDARGKTARWGP